MLTDTERRQRAIDLASQVHAYLRQRLADVTARAEDGRASRRQVREARDAYAASSRALRNLKRRAERRTA